MERELKIEFVEHATFTISSSVLDYAPKFSPRSQISFIKVYFSAAC